MRNTFLITLLAFLSPSLIVAQSTDESGIVRLNAIYVDEILDGGDEGIGATVEFAATLNETDDIFQTAGFEIGYIKSDAEGDVEGFDFEATTDVVPILFNLTVGSVVGESSGFVWEAGVGIGAYFVELEFDLGFLGNTSDDDVIIGGQIFGSAGYQFTENVGLLGGIRYMVAEDADMFGVEDEVINSIAFDLSLNFTF